MPLAAPGMSVVADVANGSRPLTLARVGPFLMLNAPEEDGLSDQRFAMEQSAQLDVL